MQKHCPTDDSCNRRSSSPPGQGPTRFHGKGIGRLAGAPNAIGTAGAEVSGSRRRSDSVSDAAVVVNEACDELVPKAPADSAQRNSFVFAVSAAMQRSHPESAAHVIEKANWPWIKASKMVSKHINRHD